MSMKTYHINISKLSPEERKDLLSWLDANSFITHPISVFDGLYESFWDEANDLNLSKHPALSRCTVKEI